MSTEENKALIRRISDEVINKGNFALTETLIAEDWQPVDPSPGQEAGRKSVLTNMARLRTAFPDLERTITDMVAEGDTVVQSFTIRGTHLGEFMGIPPTGKRVAVRGMAIDTIAAGQCKATRMLLDNLSLLQQLGVIPAPGQ